MPSKRELDFALHTAVDDELYDELSELVGQKLVYIAVWEDSLADALGQTAIPPAEAAAAPLDDGALFDLDLYLADGIFFELYGTACFSDPDAEPWAGLEETTRLLLGLLKRGLWLEEIAVTEEDDLVLVLGQDGRPLVYLQVGGWLIEEWDELPEL